MRGTVSIRSGPHRVKALGIRKRQAFNQNAMYDAEDRGVGADAECERQDSNEREARRFAELAKSKFEIVHVISNSASLFIQREVR